MPISMRLLEKYHQFGDVLVETGTYLGETVENGIKIGFKDIYSIELSKELYAQNVKKFHDFSNVHLFEGDSGKILGSVIEKITSPVVFWLDGHWSDGITARGDKDFPLLDELDAIAQHRIKSHILMIDDVRCIEPIYSMQMIKDKILKINFRYVFNHEDGFCENDILVAKVVNEN